MFEGEGRGGEPDEAMRAALSPMGRAFAAALEAAEVSHPRFRGPKLDPTRLTPEDLAALMILRDRLGQDAAPQASREAAFQIHDALSHRRPRFTPETGPACLRGKLAVSRAAAGEAAALSPAAGGEAREEALWRLGHEADDLQWRFVLVAASEEPSAAPPELAAEILAFLREAEALTAPGPDLDEDAAGDDAPHDDAPPEDATPESETRDGVGRVAHPFAPHRRAMLVLAAAGGERTAAEVARALAELDDAPLARLEAEACLSAPLRQHAEIALRHKGYPNTPAADERECARFEGYAGFAEEALRRAEAQLADLHEGRAPYRSDKAFAPLDCDALEIAMRIGLAAGAPWAESRIAPLLGRVCLAPGKAKTAPSQALTHRFGRAVADFPSPAGVLALRQARGVVRHAGLRKKLEKLSREAERALSARPDFILLLPEGEALAKPLLQAAKRSFEALYQLNPSFEIDVWRARFWERLELRPLCARLIWRLDGAEGGFSAMPAAGKGARRGELIWRDAGGAAVSPPAGARLRLWHPLSALAEEGWESLEAWRAAIIAAGVKQPFLQAFRQHYPLSEEEAGATQSDRFAGHWVSLKPLTGAGQSAGWRFDYDLQYFLSWPGREGAELALGFFCGARYPGCDWDERTGPVRLVRRDRGAWRWRPVPFGEADPVALSEAFRSVDMITSVGARAYDPTGQAEALAQALAVLRTRNGCWNATGALCYDAPGAQSAALRRDALARIYGDDPAVSVGARQVAVGEHRLNIATGRITRHGDPIDPPPPPAKTVWIPFEDPILGDIVKAVAAFKAASR